MKIIVESMQMICIDEITIGDVPKLNLIISHSEYLPLALGQINDQSTQIYVINTFDHDFILFQAMGN